MRVLLSAFVRRMLAVIVLVSLVAACSGGDDNAGPPAAADDTRSAQGAVVRSSDGKAELTLPPGVDAEGITVVPIEVEGAAVAYELKPSGTSFDEPALLTIHDVEAPEVGWMAVGAVESGDGTRELVDADTEYDGDAKAVTVALAVPHFSRAEVWWSGRKGVQAGAGWIVLEVPRSLGL